MCSFRRSYPFSLFFSVVILLSMCIAAQASPPLYYGRVDFQAGEGPESVAAGYLDGDGNLDLAVANGGGNVSVLLGNGDGSFQSPVNYTVGDGPISLAMEDLDGDGALDVAVVNEQSNDVSVLLGNGDGTFSSPVSYEAGNAPSSIAVGDLDGDGAVDLVVGNGSTVVAESFDLSSVPMNQGDSLYFIVDPDEGLGCDSTALDVTIQGGLTWNLASDFRLSPDQANPNPDSHGNPEVWHFMESATLARDPLTYTLLPDFITDALDVEGLQQWQGTEPSNVHFLPEIGINATGLVQRLGGRIWEPDVIRVHPFSSKLAVTGWQSPINGPVSIQGSFSDMHPDCGDGVAWFVENSGGTLAQGTVISRGGYSVLMGNGDGSFQPAVHYATPCCWPKSVALEDLDGDGVLDLATANGGESVSVLLGNGDGTFGPPVNYDAERISRSIAIGDLNGDDHPDLAVANRYRISNYQGSVSVLLGNGDGTFQSAVNYDSKK